ncbi:hypothetical protein O9G_006165 [Rozella allomycis CSF55]|uniref:Uncharacterized protein n=1 Tax=Rozella allomycis (strain CSF55) TaxID=988480 RepID=A0A075ARR8_ROZAC|nr:hypothetical protein O9G_006165 [Rozella allomycis CSF55]|eukprot:EPZ31218.1 hypothetical protein O9G_006165 [Rozella allomycis CSF55]
MTEEVERSPEEERALQAIPQTNLKRWRKNENKFLDVENKRTKKTFHKGRKPKHEDIHNQILELVNDLRSSLIPISCTDLTEIVRGQFSNQLGNSTSEGVRTMLRRLLKKNNYVRRRVTSHTRPEVHVDLEEQKANYIAFIKNVLEDVSLLKSIPLNNIFIINADQTAVFFENIPKYTLSKLGEKNPRAFTLGSSKNRLTAMCTIVNNVSSFTTRLPNIANDEDKIDVDLRKITRSPSLMSSPHEFLPLVAQGAQRRPFPGFLKP